MLMCSACALGPPTQDEMARLLAAAAQMPAAEIDALREGGDPATLPELRLTAAALTTEPADWMPLATSGDSALGLARLAAWTDVVPPDHCLVAPAARGGAAATSADERSLLWPESITEIAVAVAGDAVTGTVTFTTPGCFAGRLPFSLHRGVLGWRVASFDLPASGRRLVAQSGHWQLEPAPPQPPPPDLRCKLLPDPLDLHLAPPPQPLLLGNGKPIELSDVAAWAQGRVVTLRWDEAGSVAVVRSVLDQLGQGELAAETLFLVTPMDVGDCWCMIWPPAKNHSLLDSRRGWVAGLERVQRGALGVAPLPRVRIGAAGVEVVGRQGQSQWAAHSLELWPLLEGVAAAGNDSAFVVEVADDAALESLGDVLDCLKRKAEATRVLLLLGGSSGLLLQMKEPTWTPQFELDRHPRSIPAPPRSVATPRARSQRVAVPGPTRTPLPAGRARFVPGGPITEPQRIAGVEPAITEAARRALVRGLVVLELVVDRDGRVVEVKVLRGLPLGLTEAAVAAAHEWRYRPATLDGEPVEVVYVVSVRFDPTAAPN